MAEDTQLDKINRWLKRYSVIIWFIGLLLIGGYILYDYTSSCKEIQHAYYAMLLGEWNYTQYLLANGWETVPYPAYQVVEDTYRSCQYVLCVKQGGLTCGSILQGKTLNGLLNSTSRVSMAKFQQAAGALELCEMKLCKINGKHCNMRGQQPSIPQQIPIKAPNYS